MLVPYFGNEWNEMVTKQITSISGIFDESASVVTNIVYLILQVQNYYAV